MPTVREAHIRLRRMVQGMSPETAMAAFGVDAPLAARGGGLAWQQVQVDAKTQIRARRGGRDFVACVTHRRRAGAPPRSGRFTSGASSEKLEQR